VNAGNVAAINAEKEVKELSVTLPMFAGKEVALYSDRNDRSPQLNRVVVSGDGKVTLKIQPEGGTILTPLSEKRHERNHDQYHVQGLRGVTRWFPLSTVTNAPCGYHESASWLVVTWRIFAYKWRINVSFGYEVLIISVILYSRGTSCENKCVTL